MIGAAVSQLARIFIPIWRNLGLPRSWSIWRHRPTVDWRRL